MKVGIDGSNLRGGGTVTYLVELLQHAVPAAAGIKCVEVWSGNNTLRQLPDRPWLVKRCDPFLDKSLSYRVRWQRHSLPLLSRQASYDVLFAPGGTCTGRFSPVVTMSQNMLPFHTKEFLRYGPRWMLLRNLLLRLAQSKSFRVADGVIFLNEYARDTALNVAGCINGRTAIIPHGIPSDFRFPPRPQKPIREFHRDKPYRLLYVSTIDEYKHQWHVVEAVGQIHQKGVPIVLDLVGASYEPSRNRLQRTLSKIDPSAEFITYHGFVAYKELPRWYERSNLFVFASTCENQPIALLEAMAAGLPIACSGMRPMSDMLGANAAFFDPMEPREIADAIERLLLDVEFRERCASEAFARASSYSWDTTAKETFAFLADIARGAVGKKGIRRIG